MRLSLPLRLLAVLLGATSMGQAASKSAGSPMKRIKRMLEGEAAATTATSTATKPKSKLVDSWATDPVLMGAKRLMNGDHTGLLMDMAMGKEMLEIFSNPEAAHQLLQGKRKRKRKHQARQTAFPSPPPRAPPRPSMCAHSYPRSSLFLPPSPQPLTVFPMFKALAGVEVLAAKAKEDFTLDDVRTHCTASFAPSLSYQITAHPLTHPPTHPPLQSMAVLGSYRNFVAQGLKGVKEMADPVKLATKMNEYSDAVAPRTLQVRPTHPTHPPTLPPSSSPLFHMRHIHPPTHLPTYFRLMARTVP